MIHDEPLVPVDEIAAARKLLKHHFPDYPWSERELKFQAHFLSKDWLTAGSLVDAIDARIVQARLDKIERLTNELWKEYHALPLRIRRNPSDDIWKRIMRIKYDLTGRTPFVHRDNKFQSVFNKSMPRKNGFIDTMRDRVKQCFSMHQHQRDNEFAKKVKLAERADELWTEFKKADAPRKASAGTAYYSLVADMIGLAGQKWSVDSVLRAYRKYLDHDNGRDG